ncbi:hypothetical protein [Nocardia cyriacigeorgica]|uniref:Uncharacterized protein n=2 Tax=Nocardia cyriacigeorgica TaxID=135487 RepID=H6R951_NOCCG|nr:hypothetical protein [Nocardia cyriacigeorgica]TLF77769.1 hypothetical protein FEK34_15895 [Nocardia cyriacigeorgica]CCF63626.1 protein of unknown function [Nocardia cyriacigeorgica GUH-2]
MLTHLWRWTLFSYRAIWQIDIRARDPLHAARRAWDIQRDPDSPATVFDIIDEFGTTFRVDLAEDNPHLDAQPILATPPMPAWMARLLPRRFRRHRIRSRP